MTDKELKRLSRAELLEMLLIQTREINRLKDELAQAQAQLARRQIDLAQAGSFAQAALKLNDVFQAAQNAADQYLENAKDLETRTREKCTVMENQTRLKCEELERQTRQRCHKILSQARKGKESGGEEA